MGLTSRQRPESELVRLIAFDGVEGQTGRDREGEVGDYLDIVVPEAIAHCEPPSEFHG